MARVKKKKEQNLYQITNKDGNPVKFKHYDFYLSIDTIKSGKIYKSLGAAISSIRILKDLTFRIKSYGSVEAGFRINGNICSKDDLLAEILSLKIVVFKPSEIKDIMFYLDMI